MALLIDTGPLYANLDLDDTHHDAWRELLRMYPGPLIVPMLVITEVAQLIAKRLMRGPRRDFSATSRAARSPSTTSRGRTGRE
jgi:predicted nucleic acid-binding protein